MLDEERLVVYQMLFLAAVATALSRCADAIGEPLVEDIGESVEEKDLFLDVDRELVGAYLRLQARKRAYYPMEGDCSIAVALAVDTPDLIETGSVGFGRWVALYESH